jgi:aryl-alcohol dehydrogenase-like predicted oxidoreductase
MLGVRTTDEEGHAILDAAFDAGINFIDTANHSGTGTTEELIGENLRRNNMRDRVVLATKFSKSMDDEDVNASGASRRHIIKACEDSLRRLQTDHVDLYYLHRPHPQVPIDETLRALDDLIRAGKVRYIGTSTFAAWQLVESMWAAKELGLNRFVCDQSPYNLLDRRVERELLPMAETYGVAVTAWSPIAGGILSAKYSRRSPPPTESRLAHESDHPFYRDRLNDRILDVVEGVQAVAADKKCTPSQLALAWCLRQPGITTPIIGPRTSEQLRESLAALDLDVTAEDRGRLDELVPPGTMVSPYYEANFGPHRYRW